MDSPKEHGPIVEARIEQIVDLMRRFKYCRKTTITRLAEEWGLSLSHAYRYSAEASKRVAKEFGDKPRAIALVSLALEEVVADATEMIREPFAIAKETDNGVKLIPFDKTRAHNSIINAAKAIAAMSGINAAVKLKVDDEGLPADPRQRAKALRALADHVEAQAIAEDMRTEEGVDDRDE